MDEARWIDALEGAGHGVWDWNIKTGEVYFSSMWKTLLGYEIDEIGADYEAWRRLVHPDDLDNTLRQLNAFVQGDADDYRNEHRLRCKDGTYRWILAQGSVSERDARDEPMRMVGTITDITMQKATQARLAQNEQRFHAYLNVAGVIIVALDVEADITLINQKGCRLLGYAKEELIGRNWIELCIPPENREPIRAFFEGMVNENIMPPELHENEIITKTGGRRLIAWNNAVLCDAEGKPVGAISSGEDVTEKRRQHDILRQNAKVFENTSEGVMITDAQNRIIAVNRAFSQITGYSESEVVGKPPSLLGSGYHDTAFYETMWQSIGATGSWQGEIWDRKKDGTTFPEWLNISTVRGKGNRIVNYIAVFSDISKLKENEEQLEFLAHHDPLTGLANRLLLGARLEHSIQVSNRYGNQLAVCFIDLDNFKNINDGYGHSTGDRILIEVTERIQGMIRKDDSLARLGGDEFIMLLENMQGVRQITVIVKKVLHLFDQPFVIDGHNFSLSASIGMSIYPHDGDSSEELIKNADAAMYHAKEEGKNTFKFYAQEMTIASFERVLLESYLKEAVETGQFVLHYQPQISLKEGGVVGLEALIRWMHPKLGQISPDRFITLAEETRQIVPIGRFVLERACRDLRQLHDAGIFRGSMSVNVSGVQIESSDFIQTVRDVLQLTGIKPTKLEIELTETTVMSKPQKWIRLLDTLKALGVSIAIDDFGTGYSSLSQLSRLPANKLKIDRSFIASLPEDRRACSVADSVIYLSDSMQMSTLAEGVETAAQLEYLKRHKCEAVQGYYFSRPQPFDAIREWLLANPIVDIGPEGTGSSRRKRSRIFAPDTPDLFGKL